MTLAITAAIQAGGKSSRMGTDKAFALLNGRPLIQHVLERVRMIEPAEMLMIANQPDQYQRYSEITVYQDLIGDRGPLGGIFTALEKASYENVVVVGCDMPYVNPRLLEYITRIQFAAQIPYDAVVPRLCRQAQGLHALYHRSSLPVIHRRLANDELSLTGLLLELSVRFMDEPEYGYLDPDGRSFTNINTRDELRQAQNDVLTLMSDCE